MQLVQGVNMGEEEVERILGHRVFLGHLVTKPLTERDRFKQICIHFFKCLFTYQIDHFEVLFICSLGHEDFFRNEICLVCRMTLENKEIVLKKP